jgi:hypothetical protein
MAVWALGASAQLIAVHRLWGVHPTLPTTGRAVIAVLLAVSLASLWPATGAALLLVKLPAIAVAGLLTVAALGEFSPEELAVACRLLAKRPTLAHREVQMP